MATSDESMKLSMTLNQAYYAKSISMREKSATPSQECKCYIVFGRKSTNTLRYKPVTLEFQAKLFCFSYQHMCPLFKHLNDPNGFYLY